MSQAADFFSEEQQLMIKAAVVRAERNTSGEIRVCIDAHVADEPLDRAVYWFDKLKMQNTKERNGVLIFIAIEDKKFSVIGDSGIHEKVTQQFWNDLVNEMKSFFAKNDLTGGLIHAIEHCGKALSTYFPYQRNDVDELPNEMVFGER
jgi:uncharacterized membrane protein